MAGLTAGNSVDKPTSVSRSVTFPTCRIWQEFPSVYGNNHVCIALQYYIGVTMSCIAQTCIIAAQYRNIYMQYG